MLIYYFIIHKLVSYYQLSIMEKRVRFSSKKNRRNNSYILCIYIKLRISFSMSVITDFI